MNIINISRWGGRHGDAMVIDRIALHGCRFIKIHGANQFKTTNTTKDTDMKAKQILLTVFSVATFAVGCKQEADRPTVSEASADAAAQMEKAKQETREAVQATKEYAYAQKAEFLEATRAELAEMNRNLDELSAKAENFTGAAKEEARAKIQALREQISELNKRLDDVGNSTESTWDEVKANFKKGYDKVKESFNEARQWLSDKIAP